ncbi:MAG: ABC transporter permease, partial [Alphaproteobacteria bacterium]|nr:ABC transporter permease [Alphaproteobacteria bacterium]
APAVLLSGFMSPVENMPNWMQTLTLINPLRHFLVVAQGIFLKDLPTLEVARNTAPLILIAAITLPAAAWLFRKKTA